MELIDKELKVTQETPLVQITHDASIHCLALRYSYGIDDRHQFTGSLREMPVGLFKAANRNLNTA